MSYKLSDTTEETTIESCDKSEVIYDKSVVTSSLVEDFEMICSEAYQRDIINSIFMIGSALGSGNHAFSANILTDSYYIKIASENLIYIPAIIFFFKKIFSGY